MNGCTGLLSTATRPSRREVSLRCHVDSRPSGLSVSLIKTTRAPRGGRKEYSVSEVIRAFERLLQAAVFTKGCVGVPPQ